MAREIVVLVDSNVLQDEQQIETTKQCVLRLVSYLHFRLGTRWCFRVMDRDMKRRHYNHIQLMGFNRHSMKSFENSLNISSDSTSSSGSDASQGSKNPLTLKTLCRSIASVLEHIDAARLDPLLAAQRKVSRKDRKVLGSNVQTAIFVFGEIPDLNSEFCEGEQKEYTKYVCNQIRRHGFGSRKSGTVSLSWIDLNSSISMSKMNESLRILNGAVIPSNVLLDKTFRTLPVSAILRYCHSNTTRTINSSSSSSNIQNVDMYIESQICPVIMTRVVTTTATSPPQLYEDANRIEIRLQGWIRSRDVPKGMIRLEMNEANVYALGMSSSMERIRSFMKKSKRCGILDIITISKNGRTKYFRGGLLFAMESSLWIRDIPVDQKNNNNNNNSMEEIKGDTDTLTEIWSSTLSEFSFPSEMFTTEKEEQQDNSELVRNCEDWVRNETKKMEEDTLLSKELGILTTATTTATSTNNNSQQNNNFNTVTRKISLEETKEMLKNRYEMFTTNALQNNNNPSTFVTQDLYNAEEGLENPAQLRDWLRETLLFDTSELSKKHPGIFIAGSDVVEQTLREYEMQMMLTLELSLPCGHWRKDIKKKTIKDPVDKSTKKRLKRLIGRMSLIMNTSKEQSKSVSFYLESELVRMYANTLPYTLLLLYRVLEIEDHDVPDVLQSYIEEKKKRKQEREDRRKQKNYTNNTTVVENKKKKKRVETTKNKKTSTAQQQQPKKKIPKKTQTKYQSIAATETIARGLAEKKKLVHSHYSHGMSNMNKLLTNVKIGNTTKLLKKKIRKKRKASTSLVKKKKSRLSSPPLSTKKHIVDETPIKSQRVVQDTPTKSNRVVVSTPVKSKCVAETPMKTSSEATLQKIESPMVVRIRSRMISETPNPKRRRRRK